MNKKVLIIVAVLVVCFLCVCGIIGGGVYLYNQTSQSKENSETDPFKEVYPASPDYLDDVNNEDNSQDEIESQNDDSSNSDNDDLSFDSEGQTTEETVDSLSKIFESNDNLKCDWSVTVEDAPSGNASGVMYITKDKLKMDLASSGEKVYIVYKDQMGYMWSDGSNTGMKYPVEDISEFTEGFDGEMPQLDGNYKFKCDRWTVDNSVFNLPTNVTFMDTSDLDY
jgi:hypothetical protein